jgi:PAS domain S-box-containing protein
MEESISTRDYGAGQKPKVTWTRLFRVLGALPVILIVIGIPLVYYSGIKPIFESPALLAILNTVFLFFIPLVMAILAARSQIKTGAHAFLFMGCSFIGIAICSFLAGWVMPLTGGPNATVTIHNIGMLLAGIFQFIGARKFLKEFADPTANAYKKRAIFGYYLVVAFAIGVLTVLVLFRMLPIFFIPATGPTLIRQVVLVSAVMCFLASALYFMEVFLLSRSGFCFWYGLGLLLMAAGLSCILLQRVTGGPINWAGRIVQYVGCVYFLFSLLSAKKAYWGQGKTLPARPLQGLWPEFEVLIRERTEPLKILNASLNREIQERKLAERMSLESANRLELAVMSARLGVWDWDVVNNKMVWNDRMYELYGVMRNGSPSGIEIWQNGLHPDDYAFAWDSCQAALRGESKYDIEFRVRRPDGQVRFIKADGIVLRGEGGRPLRMIGINHDITDRKMTEELIRQKDVQFQKLSFNVPDLIFQFTRKPDGSYCVPFASEGIRNIFGCAPEDVRDDFGPIARVIHPEDSDRVIRDIEYSAEHMTYFTCEFRVQIPGRPVQWIYSRSSPEKLPDGSITWYGFNADITEKKKNEEMMVKTQKLESLGILAGGVAHDFNNLLSILYGNLQLMQGNPDPEEVNQSLGVCLNTMQRAKSITSQLLTFARGGAPKKSSADLMPFLEKTVRFALSGSKCNVDFDIETGPLIADYDEGQMGQVIDNLVINALQAMPQGGTLTVSAEHVSLRPQDHPPLAPGKYIKVSFRDSGIGMPPNVLSRIFDPYFTTKETGRGLGLASVYSIIRQHDGGVEVESTPGKGTVFHLLLPVSQRPIHDKGISSFPTPKGTGKILVMDDELELRSYLVKILNSAGYQTVGVGDGRKVLELLKDPAQKYDPFTAVILDLTVPGGMGGKETVEEIRRSDPRLPVFVVSGYGNDSIMANPARYGFSGSLTKPFTTAELLEMLNKARE